MVYESFLPVFDPKLINSGKMSVRETGELTWLKHGDDREMSKFLDSSIGIKFEGKTYGSKIVR